MAFSQVVFIVSLTLSVLLGVGGVVLIFYKSFGKHKRRQAPLPTMPGEAARQKIFSKTTPTEEPPPALLEAPLHCASLELPKEKPERKLTQIPQVFFWIVVLLSLATAAAPFFFSSEKQNLGLSITLFLGTFTALIGVGTILDKVSIAPSLGYGTILTICAAVIAFHLMREMSSRRAFTPLPHLWKTIATLPSSSWTDKKAYSVFIDGQFDLSEAQWMRIGFDASQAGTRFLLRLVPQGGDYGEPIGARGEVVVIPADGVVILPLKAEEFALSQAQMRQLIQISIHSGSNAWSFSLEQNPDKHADFKKIEIQ